LKLNVSGSSHLFLILGEKNLLHTTEWYFTLVEKTNIKLKGGVNQKDPRRYEILFSKPRGVIFKTKYGWFLTN